MPIGSFTAVPYLAKILAVRRPARILDLGIGSGFLGAIVRQWVDLGVQPWRSLLIGVEVWAEYRNPLWDLYNLVIIETIQEYLSRHCEEFDCILLGDVLEHFEIREGVELLEQLKSRVAPDGVLLVATPAQFHEQAAVHGNEFERHRSVWTAQQLEELGFQTLLSGFEPQISFVPTLFSFWEPRLGSLTSQVDLAL
ncbi:class I SAM-dependent methyltransferase [Tundrisphaera lichenicola]|uniref:class I SAM-dependent methyltransferase n=1 Tax=Tundrisphaera lichenicola TaxID=2029860 RepID=UPI003EB916F8